MSRLPAGLMLITDRRIAVQPPVEVCRAALEAGFRAVMIREKDLEGRALLELAEPIHASCRRHDAACLINDRVDVALALEGAGAHVGRHGIPVADARRVLGPDRLLGYSAHEVEEAAEALDAGADYVTLSPVFDSVSKAGLIGRGARWLAEGVRVLGAERIVALGGVTASTLGAVRMAGTHTAAVCGGVMTSPDPRRVANDLILAWGG